MSFPFDLVSGDAQRALEVFQSEFNAALEAVDRRVGVVAAVRPRELEPQHPHHVPDPDLGGWATSSGKRRRPDAVAVSPVDQHEAEDVGGRHRGARFRCSRRRTSWAGLGSLRASRARRGRHPNSLVAQLLHANREPRLLQGRDAGHGRRGSRCSARRHKVNVFDDAAGTFGNVLLGGNGADFVGGSIDGKP
jgi:hypothetical protein